MNQNNYPIYIISKGRWESRLTSRALDDMKMPYRIVIEPQEYEKYSLYIDKSKILVMPFSNLGQGSIPARNWVWEHSIKEGHKWHWILDDNIEAFYRLNRNKRIPVNTGIIFKIAEDFVNRYENIALSGFNYRFLCKSMSRLPPYYLNTRIYSCLLIRNDVPYKWRGTYNEDTDLSIRVLKDGWCTLLFNVFLIGKKATMTMKGGNTDELYILDGRKKMAESLQKQHPDSVKVSYKFGHEQHHVNYKLFKKNRLIKKPNLVFDKKVNNYGMVIKETI